MKTNFDLKLRRDLVETALKDLARAHPHAHERVGFVLCRRARSAESMMLLAESYLPVADEDYVFQQRYGATINANAFRKAMQCALSQRVSILHVHCHGHAGRPGYSKDDTQQSERFIPDFWNVLPGVAHGTLLLSRDQAIATAWDPATRQSRAMRAVTFIGFPTTTFWSQERG